MVQIREILLRLNNARVEYVIIGGVAARMHGSPVRTADLDVCCAMTEQNMARLIAAIGQLHPIFRGDPRRLALPTNPEALSRFRTLILATDLGPFDVLKEVEGVGQYDSVFAQSGVFDVEGQSARVIDIDPLIEAKSRAGRDKDKFGVMHLEAIKKRRENPPSAT